MWPFEIDKLVESLHIAVPLADFIYESLSISTILSFILWYKVQPSWESIVDFSMWRVPLLSNRSVLLNLSTTMSFKLNSLLLVINPNIDNLPSWKLLVTLNIPLITMLLPILTLYPLTSKFIVLFSGIVSGYAASKSLTA